MTDPSVLPAAGTVSSNTVANQVPPIAGATVIPQPPVESWLAAHEDQIMSVAKSVEALVKKEKPTLGGSAKAIVGAIGAGMTALTTILSAPGYHGHMSIAQWVTVGAATLLSGGTVYTVSNAKTSDGK